jgi:nucleotide-binding universal stress UspA family protein
MNILLPVDGSDYTKRMLAYVAAHDELLGAGHDYTFFTSVAPIPSHATRFLERGMLDGYYDAQAEQVFKPVRAFADQHHWTYRTVHVHGHAAEEIARIAEAGNYDLIVMGSHGQTALGNMILGSTASGVLARCKLPVLLIR